MAKSKYEYVKQFENHSTALPNTWMVVRIDGHSFHRFTSEHKFDKPNDRRGLDLANFAAVQVMNEMQDVILGYGQSDEYSFVFRRETTLYKRREFKIVSTLVSMFTGHYICAWSQFFPDKPLLYPPSFDGRIVLYPSNKNLRDYMSWRQYNTCFWSLVANKESPMTEQEAQNVLKDTDSAAKNELLYSKFGINYNSLPDIFRKGSVLFREKTTTRKIAPDGVEVAKTKIVVTISHVDIIGDEFWQRYSLLSPES